MGGFLLVSSAAQDHGEFSFAAARALHEAVHGCRAGSLVDRPGIRAASFPRINGSGSPIVHSDDEQCWLLACGTWFHRDGYSSGAEARLLRRYEEVGALSLGGELDGFFCVVVGDARSRGVIVITDRVGSCHAFIASSTDATIVGSSSLVLAGIAGRELDPIGCQEYLATGVVYEDRTCFRQVRKLGPASVTWIGPRGIRRQERYWDACERADERPLQGDAAANALWEQMTAAAAKVSRAFPRVVCDVTGGYDSRAMLAAFLGAGVRVTTTVSGEPDSADVRVSKQIADRLGLPHMHRRARPGVELVALRSAVAMTDGEYDPLEYARIREVHEGLLEGHDISINGSFGEVARGYWWELLAPGIGAHRRLDAGRLARARFAIGAHDPTLFPAASRLDLVDHFTAVIERANAGLHGATNTLQMDHVYLSLRMQRWQGRIASSTNRLWPCLSPLMFRPVLETMLGIVPAQRLRSLVIRQMLARFTPDLAGIPLEHGYPAVPATWRNLPRFAPVLSHYGGRVAGKLARMSGMARPPAALAGEAATTRAALWQADEIRRVLDPSQMHTAPLLDEAPLRTFLEASRAPAFAFHGQWSRLLGLELAVRAIDVSALTRGRIEKVAS